jgi:hypothetical protein
VTAGWEENRGLRIKMETDAVSAAVPGMWQRMGGAGAVALAGGDTNGAAALAPAAAAAAALAGGLKEYDMNNHREVELHTRSWNGAAGGAVAGAGAGARPGSNSSSPRSGTAAGAPAPAALTGSELRVAARAVLHDKSGDEVGCCSNLKPVLKGAWFRRLKPKYAANAFKFCSQFQLIPLQKGDAADRPNPGAGGTAAGAGGARGRRAGHILLARLGFRV